MLVNGNEMDLKEGITIIDLLEELNIDKDKVVVEVNFEIIVKGRYNDRILNTEDKIEIVALVGGG